MPTSVGYYFTFSFTATAGGASFFFGFGSGAGALSGGGRGITFLAGDGARTLIGLTTSGSFDGGGCDRYGSGSGSLSRGSALMQSYLAILYI